MWTTLLITVLGWIAGMAINYLADVLPTYRRLCKPFCLNCKQVLPLGIYLLPTGRCPNCRRAHSVRSWLVNITAVGLTLLIFNISTIRMPFPISLLLLIYLGVVTIIDLEHRLILHPVTLTGALLTLPLGGLIHGWGSTIAGGLAGFGSMFAIYLLGRFLLVIVGRWRGADPEGEALGFGDVTISGVLGLLTGWPGVIAVIVSAILLGGVVSLIYMIIKIIGRQYRRDLALPYGPFLTTSAFLLLFFPQIFRLFL